MIEYIECDTCHQMLPEATYLIDIDGVRHTTCSFCIALVGDEDE